MGHKGQRVVDLILVMWEMIMMVKEDIGCLEDERSARE